MTLAKKYTSKEEQILRISLVTWIKKEPEQVALAVVEDIRKNISQFDLAYIDVDGQEVLAAFDTCSRAR